MSDGGAGAAEIWGLNEVAPMSDDHRVQLVFQVQSDGAVDFDGVIRLEEMLRSALGPWGHLVDGHDFGSGSANIFVHSALPAEAFAIAEQIMKQERGNDWTAGGRVFERPDSPWMLLWPNNLASFDLMATQADLLSQRNPHPRTGAQVTTSVKRVFNYPGRGLVRLLALDLAQGEEDFFIVNVSQDVFAQTQRLDAEHGGGFLVEYRDGSPDRHFGFTAVSEAEAADAVSDWLFEVPDWEAKYLWTRVKL